MGKYMKKAKIAGEVAVMESSLGVRTRARTRILALQRLQRAAAAAAEDAYLQLRNRRLEKPPVPWPKEEPSPRPSPSPSPRSSHSRLGAAPLNSGSVVGSVSIRSCCSKREEASPEIDGGGGVEVSFGENILDVEVKARNARETTPCSLIRDSETIGTPGSTTRRTNSTATKMRTQNSMLRNMPTAQEIEEFFTGAEQLQQRTFAERYNFDPVNGRPLPGRYEWVKLDD